MTGFSRFGPPNANKVVLFTYLRKTSHQIPTSPELSSPNDMNTLHNVYVVEECIQLTFRSNAEIIATCTGTKILRRIFLMNTLKVAASMLKCTIEKHG